MVEVAKTNRLAIIAFATAIWCAANVTVASVPPHVRERGQAGQADPDWPCIQRKVPELSVAAVWSGPPVEDALATWRDDPEIAGLVTQLAARRLPLEEAIAAVSRFAQGMAPNARAEKLTLLFAGLFQTLDRERSDVIAGIERYGRKQKEMAQRIRSDMARASNAALAATDPRGAAELQARLVWETRIFNERRGSLTFVCEVPTIIEQRLFALARAIGAELAI